MSEVKEYIIWNEAKCDCRSYEELVKKEGQTAMSYSSVVKTDDITGLMAGIYNEADVDMSYIECYSSKQSLILLKWQLSQAKYIIEASENNEALALLTTMEIMGL